MQKAMFVANCDVEMGDIVEFMDSEWVIYDIVAVHSIRMNKVEFNFILNKGKDLVQVKDRNDFRLLRYGKDEK